MKISLNHLEMAVNVIRKNYAQRDGEDLEINITIKDGDPGSGNIVDVLRFDIEQATEYSMQRNKSIKDSCFVEVYPKHDKQPPIFEFTVSKKLGQQ